MHDNAGSAGFQGDGKAETTPREDAFRSGPPAGESALVVVDVQGLFLEKTPWHIPHMADIFPALRRLIKAAGARTIFTRFMTPRQAADVPGSWQTYYRRWQGVLAGRLPGETFDVVGEIAGLAPEAPVYDKFTYSAFEAPSFEKALRRAGARHLVFAGVETDVCVLATLMGAVDRGYVTWLVRDAVTSADPGASDAIINTVLPRLPEQVHVVTSDAVATLW